MKIPLAVASDGYLYKGKNPLSIAASGYLVLGNIIPPIPPVQPPVGGGSSGGSFGIKLGIDSVPRRSNKKIYYTNKELNKVELDDEDFLIIIKTFLKCQK